MFKLQRIPLQIELLLNELAIFFSDHQWLRVRYIANKDTIEFITNNSKNINADKLKKFLLAA